MIYRHNVFTMTIDGKKYATDLVYPDKDQKGHQRSREYYQVTKGRSFGSFHSHVCSGCQPEDLIQYDPYFQQFEFIDQETFVEMIKAQDLT